MVGPGMDRREHHPRHRSNEAGIAQLDLLGWAGPAATTTPATPAIIAPATIPARPAATTLATTTGHAASCEGHR